MVRCVRCGEPDAPVCRFHPDAKAFAFGTGRFQYGYTSAWDTPHDRWFCCNASGPECPGCCEEPTHTDSATWWESFAHLAPPIESEPEESSSSEEHDDGANEATAMELG